MEEEKKSTEEKENLVQVSWMIPKSLKKQIDLLAKRDLRSKVKTATILLKKGLECIQNS